MSAGRCMPHKGMKPEGNFQNLAFSFRCGLGRGLGCLACMKSTYIKSHHTEHLMCSFFYAKQRPINLYLKNSNLELERWLSRQEHPQQPVLQLQGTQCPPLWAPAFIHTCTLRPTQFHHTHRYTRKQK